WMGAVLIGLAVGVLVIDQRLEPWYPFLFALLLLLAEVACYEILHLLPPARRPFDWLCYTTVGALLVVNWLVHGPLLPETWDRDPWHWIAGVLAGATLAAFLVEMAYFRQPGEAILRIALTLWIACYLGL